MTKPPLLVAIPLEQGRFFNRSEKANCVQLQVAIPLEQGRFFNIPSPHLLPDSMSQSLWSRDGFSIKAQKEAVPDVGSQSLWSRDGFSIIPRAVLPALPRSQSLWSRDGFSMMYNNFTKIVDWSQSLWSRDGFSIRCPTGRGRPAQVAIPLEQGRFFNMTRRTSDVYFSRRNPFGAGTVFQWAFYR